MKIVTIIGARPQFIKAAAVSREIASHPLIQEIIVHTGQHFDTNMSDIFFEEMRIPTPHYRLDINNMNHGAMTGRMLEKIEDVLTMEQPDYVLVYGDTNTTLAGALAAKKLHISVVHVEAGLRSFNMKMPEEINRILTDRISDILCCPTETAVRNLHQEGFSHFPCALLNVGDVMLDAALYYSQESSVKSHIIKTLNLRSVDFLLCTVHRAENTDDPERLASIFRALNMISRECRIILPLHPRTAKLIKKLNISLDFAPIDPIGYFDMIELLKKATVVITDSGGLQKEAYFFSKPCITIRDETEWTELVEGGFNILAGSHTDNIYACYKMVCNKQFSVGSELYGNGHASCKIVNELLLRGDVK